MDNIPSELLPDSMGIILTAEDVTPTAMTLVCTQSGGSPTGELQTGRPFTVEIKKANGWEAVPLSAENAISWTAEAWSIPMEDQVRWAVSWKYLYGELPPGTYRLSKIITDFRSPGDFDNYTHCTEFTIE